MKISAAFSAALADGTRVSDAPHDFYRYPARFSPTFAREAIRTFTKPGEVVLDPFCGGGTSIVEAVALGRRAIGADINSLATFLTRTKTTPLSSTDYREIAIWLDALRHASLNARLTPSPDTLATVSLNLPSEARRFFRWILDRINFLPSCRQQSFVRLILLGVGQRAVDCRTRNVSRVQLRLNFCKRLEDALAEFSTFTSEAATLNGMASGHLPLFRRVIDCPSERLHEHGLVPKSWLPAKLVLTSPPYPGVHVLYHRWQIKGRRETATPFWLANQRDGSGESHYLLGPRGQEGLGSYFDNLQSSFSSIASMLDHRSTVVQLVAFSDPTWQLHAYLRAMRKAGFIELKALKKRLWRTVPSRKWYARGLGDISTSKEVMLLHQLA